MTSRFNLDMLNYSISPLDSWLRCQGSTTASTNKTASNEKTRLPNLLDKTINYNYVAQKKAKSEENATTKIFASNSQPCLDYNARHRKQPDRCRTPKPSVFYQKCIDDVCESNQPKDLKLVLPRELTYVRSLPFIKYVTYGTGKCFDGSVWQIKMFNPGI